MSDRVVGTIKITQFDRITLSGEPFFHPLCLATVALFAANNFWWKAAYHNALTGKLSDFMLCFFLPLYVAAVLRPFTARSARLRISAGSLVTIAIFTAVKTSTAFSLLLHEALAPWGMWIWGAASQNIVDPTDLVALLSVAGVWWWPRRRNHALAESQ